jgi:hypothetical protein
MSTYQEFKNKWLGKGIDYDGAYGFQCFDVINQYILEMTGQRPLMKLMKASDIFKRPEGIFPDLGKWQIIPNSHGLYPKQGDIIVWDDAGWNGFYGHTAIIDSANNDNCQALQQNGLAPTLPCKIQFWNFWSTPPLGWIRLVVETVTPETPFLQHRVLAGDTQYKLAKQYGYPVTVDGTSQDDKKIYARLTEINPQTGGRLFPNELYNIDRNPVEWFNSTIQPQPEALTTPAQPTMPTITMDEPIQSPNPTLELDTTLEIQRLEKENDDLRNQIVHYKKAEMDAEDSGLITLKDLVNPTKEKFNLNKLSVGVVRAKNPITTPPIFATIGGAIGVLTENKPEITLALTLIGTALGLLYPIAVKFLDRLKLIAEALNSKK